jgi:hypothetical protein
MLDKLKFWKKSDDINMNFNNPTDEPLDLGLPGDPLPAPDLKFEPMPEENNMNMQTDPLGAQFNNPMPQQNSTPTYPQQPMTNPVMQEPARVQQEATIHPRDIELVLSKIETLKASVDHLTTRIEHLEMISNDKKRW